MTKLFFAELLALSTFLSAHAVDNSLSHKFRPWVTLDSTLTHKSTKTYESKWRDASLGVLGDTTVENLTKVTTRATLLWTFTYDFKKTYTHADATGVTVFELRIAYQAVLNGTNSCVYTLYPQTSGVLDSYNVFGITSISYAYKVETLNGVSKTTPLLPSDFMDDVAFELEKPAIIARGKHSGSSHSTEAAYNFFQDTDPYNDKWETWDTAVSDEYVADYTADVKPEIASSANSGKWWYWQAAAFPSYTGWATAAKTQTYRIINPVVGTVGLSERVFQGHTVTLPREGTISGYNSATGQFTSDHARITSRTASEFVADLERLGWQNTSGSGGDTGAQ